MVYSNPFQKGNSYNAATYINPLMDWCHRPLSFGKASHVLTIRHIICHDRFSNPKVKRSHWWNSVLQLTPWYLQFQTPHGTWPEPILGVPKDNRNFQRAEASPSQNVASRSLKLEKRSSKQFIFSSTRCNSTCSILGCQESMSAGYREPKKAWAYFPTKSGVSWGPVSTVSERAVASKHFGFFLTLTLNSHLGTVRCVSLIPWWWSFHPSSL